MNKWLLFLSLFSAALYSSSDFSTVRIPTPDYNPPEIPLQEQQNIVCASVVCNSTSDPQSVPAVGEVPEREPNQTIETIASAIYIIGEIGVAENLSTPEYEQFFEN
ncbi:hypothetical protein AB4277_14970 [Vibrio splendidus]